MHSAGFLAGIDVRIVSERLGHSSPLVTWQTYQHVIQGMQADAADRVAELVFGPGATETGTETGSEL